MNVFHSDPNFDSLPASPISFSFDALNLFSPDRCNSLDLTSALSSDEIPVFLYDEGYIEQDLLISKSISVNARRNSVASTIRCARQSSDLFMSSLSDGEATLGAHSRVNSTFLASLESYNTISSVGTFGPKLKSSKKPGSAPNYNRSATGTLAEFIPANTSSAEDSAPFDNKRSRSSMQSLTGIFASPSVLAVGIRNSKSIENSLSRTSDMYKSRKSSLELEELSSSIRGEDEHDIISTPTKSIPKTISWISSRNWDSQQYKDYIANISLTPLPNSGVQAADIDDAPKASRRHTPVGRRVLDQSDMILETPRASQFALELNEHRRENSDVCTSNHPTSSDPIRLDDVSWLKDITVQFLMDQEGFRAAQPNFRFTGMAKLRSSPMARFPDTVMAQFRPIFRQSFHFHYAPFETPPVLRRVTVNFDENYDYLSRQGQLTLKCNGVYVLHGHEMSPASHNADSCKLHWQFEYLVDDRRVEGSGRIIEGEKIMTPLTFSCAPGLVLPTHGKRNNIMHVFKKGVASKLVAEKLQPPIKNTIPANRLAHSVKPSSDAETASHLVSSKSHTLNAHRRGQSHGIRQHDVLKTSHPSNVHAQYLTPRRQGIPNTKAESLPPKRRRASSAGEHRRPFNSLRFNTTNSSASPIHPPGRDASDFAPTMRHILPPAQWAKLLDAESEENVPPVPAPSAPNDPCLIPLTPRPRYTPHVKLRDPA